MFGYVKPNEPYLYKKDDVLYNALYCSTCKCLGKNCGQRARLTLTYDITFLSLIIHNIKGIDVDIKKSHCVTHIFRKRPMAKIDEIGLFCADVNVILSYNKILDDITDVNKGKIKRLFLKKAYKKACKRNSKIDEIVKEEYDALRRLENENCASLDVICDPFANMLKRISIYSLQEKSTPATENLFYQIGKWIYLIDALDDIEKDVKNKNYNPFVAIYGNKPFDEICKSQELAIVLNGIFISIKEELNKIDFKFNCDLINNILLMGLPTETQRILKKELKNG